MGYKTSLESLRVTLMSNKPISMTQEDAGDVSLLPVEKYEQAWQPMPEYTSYHAAFVARNALPGKWEPEDFSTYRVSPQGFTRAWMDEFMAFLENESPDWLDGVVFGPWVQMTMAEFRQHVPTRYAIRNYPDITHSLNCQFPVPEWDLAFALTLGREGINPRPEDEATVFHLYQPGTIGFLTYSEGCNDDVNKVIWSGLGWLWSATGAVRWLTTPA